MKKLLYYFALAFIVTSCSVDNINEENSVFENDTLTRAAEANDACASAVLVNQKGVYRGTVEAFMDYYNGDIVLKFTTVDWKIKESKMFFGPDSQMNANEPNLFTLGKYTYSESFKEGVYVANYVFAMNNVTSDFSLLAMLNIKNDYEIETIMVDGSVAGNSKMTYVKEFVKYCYEKPTE
ncbi:MAG: hypothetical protein HKM99_10295 [Flavobacteriaceae bacterium]|nr:hypothetical protein [Flavobacteriaceae bacterium]